MGSTTQLNKAQALVDGVRAREERATAALYECVKQIVRRRFAKSWPQAWEDLLHDTYIEVLKNIDKLQNAAALFGFIRTIAARLQNRYIGEAMRSRDIASGCEEQLESPGQSPYHVLLEREMWQQVQTSLSRMKAPEQWLVKTILDDRSTEWVQERVPHMSTRQICLARSRAKLKLIERVAQKVTKVPVPVNAYRVSQPLPAAA